MDWNAFGYDNSRGFVLIYGALKGSALKKAGPFYETGGAGGTRDSADFIKFLDRWNLDPMRVARAIEDLHNLRMRENQSWPDFFATWSNKLNEARGDFWDDANKISMIRTCLSDKLIRKLAGNHPLPENNFSEWVRIVNQVAQQLEMVYSRARRQNPRTQQNTIPGRRGELQAGIDRGSDIGNRCPADKGERNHGKLTYASTQPGELDWSGDTIMSGINAAAIAGKEKRRAKWKSEAQIAQLRKEGRCFRCERQGCLSRKCPLLPARNPGSKGPIVNSSNLLQIDLSVFVIDDSMDNEDPMSAGLDQSEN